MATGEPHDERARPRVVVVVTSPLAHRKIFYSSFLEAALPHYDVEVWCHDPEVPHGLAPGPDARLKRRSLPAVHAPRVPGKNLLRVLNDFVWDFAIGFPSRLEGWTLLYRKEAPLRVRLLRAPAWLLGKLGARHLLDRFVGWLLQRERLAPEAAERLRADPPDALLVTWPHDWREQAIAREAVRLRIPVLGQILSFDNLSTKGRFHVAFDRMLVWSRSMAHELHLVHPRIAEAHVEVVGATQYDPFFDARYHEPRAAWCARHGLDPQHPVVLYTLGSPNLLDELPGAVNTAEALLRGELGEHTQLLVRPHPLFDYGPELGVLGERSPRIRVQKTGAQGAPLGRRNQSLPDVRDWVNTFRHADVVVTLASTTALDGAVADTPVINIDFEPSGRGTQTALIDSVNHRWPHFVPLNACGGVRVVTSYEQLQAALRGALTGEDEERIHRRLMVEDTAGAMDGRRGEALATALTPPMPGAAARPENSG